mmetsp:Transcript_159601/g.512143  ORF Transcript_159601/g.512143 Transcript_159601/m.512143 type:complete len:210 (-) Transcript_159601:2662-3291(-)
MCPGCMGLGRRVVWRRSSPRFGEGRTAGVGCCAPKFDQYAGAEDTGPGGPNSGVRQAEGSLVLHVLAAALACVRRCGCREASRDRLAVPRASKVGAGRPDGAVLPARVDLRRRRRRERHRPDAAAEGRRRVLVAPRRRLSRSRCRGLCAVVGPGCRGLGQEGAPVLVACAVADGCGCGVQGFLRHRQRHDPEWSGPIKLVGLCGWWCWW